MIKVRKGLLVLVAMTILIIGSGSMFHTDITNRRPWDLESEDKE